LLLGPDEIDVRKFCLNYSPLFRHSSLRSRTEYIVINIEAKADEPFGDSIGAYYDLKSNSSSNAPARISQLSRALFGRQPDDAIRKLRYQLLHAAAATLIKVERRAARVGLLLIHEFRSKNLDERELKQNSTDWENFVHVFPQLATSKVKENQILGPVSVSGGEPYRTMCRSIWVN
jgi:hypothetical protein